MATRTSAIRIAVENLDASVAALRQGGEEGRKALERIGIGAQAANQNIQGLDKAVGNFARNARSNIIQQAGYQIGDFAVQVQSGTNIVTAGTQQLSQLAGAFGVVGSVVGGVLSILGAAYTYFDKMGTSAGSAAQQLQKLDEGTKSYQSTLEALEPLQRQYLENLVQAEQAQKRVTAAFVESNVEAAKRSALNPDVSAPGATSDPGLAGQVSAEQAAIQTAQNRARIEAGISILHNERNDEDKAVAEFLLRKAEAEFKARGGGVSAGKLGFEAAGGGVRTAEQKSMAELATYDQQQLAKAVSDREAAEKKAAATSAASAKAAEAQHIANAKLLDQAKLKTAAAEAENDALYMGEDARKRANVEREYEIALLAAAQPAQKEYSLALIDEANRLRDVKLATIDRARAIEDAQKKIDASKDAAGGGGLGFHGVSMEEAKAAREQLQNLDPEAKKAAQRMQDILAEPWRHLATEVSSITTQMFDDFLTKGKISVQSLADGIGDMFKTTITGALGNAISAPLTEMANKISDGGFDFSKLTAGQTAGLGAAGGYVAGSLYSQIAGKQGTYAPVGGAVGGAAGAVAGAAIGSAFPVVGTMAGGVAGGALGSIAGSFLGGLFGGEGLGNDQSVQKFASKVGKAIWSDKSFSEENRKVTGGIIEQLGMLGEALKSTGANITDFQLELKAGAKTGIAVQGKQYATADEALVGAIRLMLQNTGGLQGSQVTALANTKGRNVQEVMGDLAFAKEFDKLTFAGTAAEAAMRDLGEQFDATGRKARELGLDEVALGAARERAMSQLTLAVQRQARDMQTQFQMATTSDAQVQAVLGVNQQFAQLTDTLTDAGYTAEQLAQVEASRAAAEQNVYRQAQEADRAQKQAAGEARRAQAEAAAEARRQAAEARIQAARQARDLNAQFRSTTSTNDLVKQIIGINTAFAQLADTLKDAGYSAASMRQLEQARQREVSQAYLEAYRQGRDLNAQFFQTVSQSPLEKTLAGINLEFAHLIETLKDAGYTTSALNEVEKARGRALEEAIKAQQKQVADMQKDLESRVLGIGSFYDQLIQPLEAVNQNNMLNPQGQIGAARTAFQRDLAGAGAQDPEAIRRLAGSAGSFQQLVSQNYGTAGVGGQYLREIQGGLGGTIAGLQQERAAALADLPQIVERTTVDIIRENRADIDRVVEQLELLRRDLRGRGIAA